VFTDKLTWRWCFYINLPLGAITIAGVLLFLRIPPRAAGDNKQTIKEKFRQLDYIGPFLFIPANVFLFLALQWGGVEYSWNSPMIIGMFLGFGVTTPIWVYSQYRLGEKATLPIRFARERTILLSSLFAFFVTGAATIPLFYIPLYFQAVAHTSALVSAIDTLPIALAVTISAIATGFLLSKIGYYTPFMLVGASLLAIGTGLMSTLLANTTQGHSFGYQIIAGVGTGLTLTVMSRKCFL
jgi:MFS family permease